MRDIMSYLKYTVGIIIRPVQTIRSLRRDPNRFTIGLFGVLTLGVLYAATAFLLYARGITPQSESLLRLPLKTHYLYQGFFNLPVTIVSWLLMGCTVYLTLPRRDVRFEDVLAVLGLPYGILVFPLMWLPETVVAIGWLSLWASNPWWLTLTPIRVALGTLWVYIVCVLAIKELYQLSLIRSLLHTLAGLIVGLGTAVIFIR